MKLGTKVTLKDGITNRCPEGRENNTTAIIVCELKDGGVRLDRDLYGIKYWNIDDLKVVK